VTEQIFKYSSDHVNIQAGAADQKSIRIEADSDFVVTMFMLSAQLAAGNVIRSRSNLVGAAATGTVSGGVGGTPTPNFESVDLANQLKLPRNAQPDGACLLPGLHLLSVQLKINDRDLQSAPIRADLAAGEPGQLILLPRPLLILKNSTVLVTLTNNMPVGALAGTNNELRGILGNSAASVAPGITAQFVMDGYKRYAR
jgi:hypothetical protein